MKDTEMVKKAKVNFNKKLVSKLIPFHFFNDYYLIGLQQFKQHFFKIVLLFIDTHGQIYLFF